MAWKVFGSVRTPRDRAMVTILSDGRISLNKTCLNKYFKAYDSVLLLYDIKEHKLGLKPVAADQRTPDTRVLRRHKKKSVGLISAVALLKYLGIKWNVTRQYVCNWNDEEDLLEFQLEDQWFTE